MMELVTGLFAVLLTQLAIAAILMIAIINDMMIEYLVKHSESAKLFRRRKKLNE